MKFAVTQFLPIAILLTFSSQSWAQDVDAFLACAEITDRTARLTCLDEALDAATTQQAGEAAAVETFGEASGRVADAPDADGEAGKLPVFRLPRIFRRDDKPNDVAEESVTSADSEEDRLDSFGRQTRVVVNENGEDELNDVIAELFMAKPNQWLIRLGSGQVWNQVHPKRLNLREGDAIRIYPTGWGDNYRLETPRLDGYIQVLRVE